MKSFNEAERIEENQESLNILIHLLTYNIEEFSLTFACCNYQQLQHKINQQLREHCPAIEIIDLDPEIDNLYSNLDRILGDQKPQGLIVSGLDHLVYLADVLQATKHAREEFRKFKFPVILWMNDRTLNTLIRSSHDFYSWGTSVRFFAETYELIDLIKRTGDRISQRLLDHGAGIFLDNHKLGLETGVNYCQELDTAHHELQERGVEVPLELIANVEFILGRGSDHSTEMTLNHYQHSLELWQQLQNPVHCALLSYHIGLWWRNYAVLHRPEEQRGCEQAATYFQQSIETFEQANHPDLAAKFINAWAEALHYLKDWETLETVINHAITLHQTHSNGFRLARGYGFLAEVKVAYSQYREAQDYARKALDLLEANLATETELLQIDWERSYHQGWYLFSLAKAQQGLWKNREAIATLERAKERTNPNYDHRLYIAILETLHQLYFNQKDYLKAFNTKQYQRQIEQQFGLRAFVGANYLQEFTFNLNPLLPHRYQFNPTQTHITAWGREQNINELMERIRRQDHKLTIIYGESGVGKSSILQAGLIPALTNKTIEAHRVIPILQRVYVNWKAELSQHLTVALQNIPNLLGSQDLEQVISFEQILNQLRQNSNRGLITVIIFDQFEEFFFEYQTTEERQEFYQLIQSCFELPYIKIIFSLRQDYLYHLLECSRLSYLNGIQNNILDKSILYYLGNFSISEAQTVIQDLTNQAQLNLEPDLIDQLVKDLGKNYTEIRPIELQITGSQLETDKIKTLEQYQELGSNPKEELVEKFLEHTVIDCGAENQQTAQLILYLLTNENNTRPLKTKTELAEELTVQPQKLDLVLKILTGSGLLLQIPAVPEDRYQLVHDYLVPFIRHKYQPLSAELQRERQQRQRWQKRSKWFSVAAFCLALGMTIFGLQANQERKKAIKQSIISQINEAHALFLSNEPLEAMVTALKISDDLQKTDIVKVTQRDIAARFRPLLSRAQEQNRLLEHQNSVLDVNFSPDGTRIATASLDQTVKLWQADGTFQQTLIHDTPVTGVRFSPQGDLIATTTADPHNRDNNQVLLWDQYGDRTSTAVMSHNNAVTSVSFNPSQPQIASASYDQTVKIWTLDGEAVRTLRGHRDVVLDVDYHPQGTVLASASADGTVKLWTSEGKLSRTIRVAKCLSSMDFNCFVYDASFSPDGQLFATASDDGTIRLWDWKTGIEQLSFKAHMASVLSVSFSIDGTMVVTGSADRTVRLWTKTGTLLKTFSGHTNSIRAVHFSPDNAIIASASEDNTVRLWSRNRNPLDIILQGHTQPVWGVHFSPDSRTLATASDDETVRLWNTETGDAIAILPHEGEVNAVKYSPDGQTLVTVSDDRFVRLWTASGELLQQFPQQSAIINSVDFSPNGELIASGDENNRVQLWTNQGQLLQTLTQDGSIDDLQFNPDGNLLAVATNTDTAIGTVQLWQPQEQTWNPTGVVSFSNGSVNTIQWINSLQVWAIGVGQTVILWSPQRGQSCPLSYEATVRSISFDPNNQTLATASDDKKVRLWQLNSDTETTLWSKPDCSQANLTLKPFYTISQDVFVNQVSFNRSGNELALTTDHGTVVLWDTQGLDLDYQTQRNCDWLNNYLNSQSRDSENKYNLTVLNNLKLCRIPEK